MLSWRPLYWFANYSYYSICDCILNRWRQFFQFCPKLMKNVSLINNIWRYNGMVIPLKIEFIVDAEVSSYANQFATKVSFFFITLYTPGFFIMSVSVASVEVLRCYIHDGLTDAECLLTPYRYLYVKLKKKKLYKMQVLHAI